MMIHESIKLLVFLLLASTISSNNHFRKMKQAIKSTSHGHDLHKDHISFLGEEAANEFYGLTKKESIRRLRYV